MFQQQKHKSITLGASGRSFEVLERLRQRCLFYDFGLAKTDPPNQENKKKILRGRTRLSAGSRAEAKEGGGGEVNLFPGSEG